MHGPTKWTGSITASLTRSTTVSPKATELVSCAVSASLPIRSSARKSRRLLAPHSSPARLSGSSGALRSCREGAPLRHAAKAAWRKRRGLKLGRPAAHGAGSAHGTAMRSVSEFQARARDRKPKVGRGRVRRAFGDALPRTRAHRGERSREHVREAA